MKNIFDSCCFISSFLLNEIEVGENHNLLPECVEKNHECDIKVHSGSSFIPLLKKIAP